MKYYNLKSYQILIVPYILPCFCFVLLFWLNLNGKFITFFRSFSPPPPPPPPPPHTHFLSLFLTLTQKSLSSFLCSSHFQCVNLRIKIHLSISAVPTFVSVAVDPFCFSTITDVAWTWSKENDDIGNHLLFFFFFFFLVPQSCHVHVVALELEVLVTEGYASEEVSDHIKAGNLPLLNTNILKTKIKYN